MQSSNDTAVIEAIEASKNFFFYGLQPTKGLDKLDQVSGTTSRSLEAPRRWGTRLGVWTRSPAQHQLASDEPGIDVALPLLHPVSPSIATLPLAYPVVSRLVSGVLFSLGHCSFMHRSSRPRC